MADLCFAMWLIWQSCKATVESCSSLPHTHFRQNKQYTKGLLLKQSAQKTSQISIFFVSLSFRDFDFKIRLRTSLATHSLLSTDTKQGRRISDCWLAASLSIRGKSSFVGVKSKRVEVNSRRVGVKSTPVGVVSRSCRSWVLSGECTLAEFSIDLKVI